jgi:hypothetical protein
MNVIYFLITIILAIFLWSVFTEIADAGPQEDSILDDQNDDYYEL